MEKVYFSLLGRWLSSFLALLPLFSILLFAGELREQRQARSRSADLPGAAASGSAPVVDRQQEAVASAASDDRVPRPDNVVIPEVGIYAAFCLNSCMNVNDSYIQHP